MAEGTGEGSTGPRLMISKIVCENFKSYAGVKELGPFHKVGITSSVISDAIYFYGLINDWAMCNSCPTALLIRT